MWGIARFLISLATRSKKVKVVSDGFSLFIDHLLQSEGGDKLVNDPDDPGGMTKFGISKRAHPEVDIENLTEIEARKIYLKEYYLKYECDKMQFPVNIIAFDAYVNMDVRAVRAILAQHYDWRDILLARIGYYILWSRKKTKRKWLRFWVIRIYKLWAFIKKNQGGESGVG